MFNQGKKNQAGKLSCLMLLYCELLLFSVTYSSCFTDDGNFYLTRIGHFILNFLSDVKR